MSNRLARATSPYLLQHAENPVDWWEFCPEAFDRARERDVPVLLSVGYAACHWCHVMAHESFEDMATARYMNEHFVSVKVDREQRPDVDSTYMAATQLLTHQGGWPMTVFLTPDGSAFHAGTYYPPRPVQGRPSFLQVMTAVTEAWTRRRDQVLRSAEQISEAISRHPELVDRMLEDVGPSPVAGSAATGNPAAELAGTWLNGLEVARDPAHEGFGTGAKFPPSPVLDALTRIAELPAPAGSAENASAARELLCATLDAVVVGALQDHVGGGFFRYSVTPDWSLPHYEKMLYDNAQLLRVLARTVHGLDDHGSSSARAARYRHAATALVHWLEREMLTPEGAFAASLDADSDPAPDTPGAEREGAYYTFSAPGHDSTDGAAVPVTASWGEAGAITGVLDETVRRALWERRATRTAPHRDDKVVTAWNGMALTALSEASVLLGHPEWVDLARTAAEFLWAHHRDPGTGTVARTSRAGVVDPHEGQLEDYAYLGSGLLSLFRATGEAVWYERSRVLAETTVARFVRGSSVAESAHVDPALAAAGATGRAEPFDDVAASSAAVLSRWLTELARPEVAGRDTAAVVSAVTRQAAGVVRKAPTAAGGMVSAVLSRAWPPELLQVADATAKQWREVLETVGDDRVLNSLVLDAGSAPYGTPSTPDRRFTVWRCRNGVCEFPVHSVAQLRT